MTDRTNRFLEFVPGRVERILKELKGRIWSRVQDLDVEMGQLNTPPISLAEAENQDYAPVESGTYVCEADADAYGEEYNHNCPWAQRWFRLQIPAADADQQGRRVLFWHCHGESTAYLNGKPWAGLDAGHEYCVLPDNACELWIDAGMWQTAIWTARQFEFAPDSNGFRFDAAWIAVRNQTAWDAWHDLSVLDEFVKYLIKTAGYNLASFGRQEQFQRIHPRARRLLRQLDDASDALEQEGLDAFASALKEIYESNPQSEPIVRSAAFGHSHLDLVWLWPREIGVRKGVHTCATMLRLMEQYPEFPYMMTQPWLFQEIAKQEPGLMDEIRKRVADGRWEFTGGMLVESDTTLACLEGLIRSIAHGQDEFRKLRGGSYSTTCFLPDAFGFNGQLPQLLTLAGIDSFFTTKMSWNRITKMPYDSFRWQALDGSEVLAQMRVSGGLSISSGMDAAKDYRQADVHDEILKHFGLGDGGGGPQEIDCERMRRYTKLGDGPYFRYSKAEEFFDRMADCRDSLPVFAGELYFEYHRGCYTSQGPMKQAFRRAESALQVREALHAIAGAAPLPQDDWRNVIFAQFHDAIPGSSILPVPRQLVPELNADADRQLDSAKEMLQTNGDSLSIFNAAGYQRKILVELEGCVDTSEQLPVQHNAGTTLVQVELPPFSSRVINPQKTTAAADQPVQTNVLDNGAARATFNTEGQLLNLSVSGVELLNAPARFMLHQDIPAKFEGWDIDQSATHMGTEVAFSGKLNVEETGPLRWTAAAKLNLGDSTSATVRYSLEKDSPLLQITVDIDWQEKRKLLRFEAPTAFRGSDAWFGCPGGSVKRPQLPGYDRAEMMWEVPGSRWSAVTDDAATQGLAIITEAKYGFSARNGLLGLSLLRAPWAPSNGMEGAARGVDQGKHSIRFALGAFQAKHGEIPNTPALADVLYMPVVQADGAKTLHTPYRVTGGETLVNSWLAPTEDGYTMRFYESMGATGSATLEFADTPSKVERVDLLGRSLETMPLKDSEVNLPYSAYQILSIHVSR